MEQGCHVGRIKRMELAGISIVSSRPFLQMRAGRMLTIASWSCMSLLEAFGAFSVSIFELLPIHTKSEGSKRDTFTFRVLK